MPQTVTVHRMQITRVVRRTSTEHSAEFNDGTWFCCQAYFRNGQPFLQARGTEMTPKEANTVAVALDMAIAWIAEEMAAERTP